MRILFINHSPEIEGSGLAMINIIKGLQQNKVSSLVVLPKNGPLVDRLKENNISCIIIPFYTSVYKVTSLSVSNFLRYISIWLVHLVTNIVGVANLARLVRFKKMDIIHTNTGVVHIGFYVALLTGRRHVWHLREYQNRDFDMRPYMGFRLFRTLLSCPANRCIAITNGIFNHFNLNKNKDCVIYDGVASEDYNAIYYKGDKKGLLFVGSLSGNKGVLDLLKAYNNIASQIQEDLILVGRDIVGVTSLINKLENGNRIKYLGVRSDVYKLMNRSKALVVPSKFEGFGFITAEAMLNFCPVIGRNTAGTKEQFDNGVKWTGKEIAWRFDTTQELENVLLQVCRLQPSDILPVLEAANISSKHYSIENNIKNIYKIYLEIYGK